MAIRKFMVGFMVCCMLCVMFCVGISFASDKSGLIENPLIQVDITSIARMLELYGPWGLCVILFLLGTMMYKLNSKQQKDDRLRFDKEIKDQRNGFEEKLQNQRDNFADVVSKQHNQFMALIDKLTLKHQKGR